MNFVSETRNKSGTKMDLIVREFHASYLKEKVWQGYGF